MRIAQPASVLVLFSLVLCAGGASPQGQQDRPATAQPAQSTPATEKKPQRPADPNKFAVIIAGVGGEPEYSKKFTGQAMRLHEVLVTQLGFDEKNVYLLTETATGGPEDGTSSRRATADEVKKAFSSIKSAANADSFLLVVLIGHGQFDNQQAKFNLIGTDLSAKDYAGLLGSLPNKRVVFVNCASSSGEFIKPMSGEGRIIITATRSGNEQNATVFADHFIGGLTDGAADTDKNGRISVIEAFNYATTQTAEWYKQKNRLATEHALLDDNADGTGHEEVTGGDGTLAKTVYLDSKQIEEAAGNPELERLIKQRQSLEEQVEKLKARKADMKQEDYDAELERVLVELAKVNQEIKAKQKK